MKRKNSNLLVLFALVFFAASEGTAQEALQPKGLSEKNWHFQIGLGLEEGNKKTAINISGTVALKRWSLNTGLTIANISNGHFKDEKSFNQNTGLDFRSVYFDGEKDTLSSINISYMNTLFQIPFVVSYNLLLPNDYTFSMGLGTDIDIYVNQRTNFEQPVKNSTTIYQQEDQKLQVVPFNNITITSGIEKKWNAFSIQLLPYISPQIKHVSYKKEDLYMGFKLRAFYNF
jgi:hypothetical protein